MSDFIFDDYARTTLSGARNSADGSTLSQQQVERAIQYLRSPGSGPDASSSYADYIARNIESHPPKLPQGADYVGFSGTDSAGVSNFTNARNYVADVGGRAGIIGDTPWGAFIESVPSRSEFSFIEGNFRNFLRAEGIEPFQGNYRGALQDMMWNAGSPKYFENAVSNGRPIVAFVENAPAGRGFSNFELPTALKHPDAVINGYPVDAFSRDPLALASRSAAEFQQLERAVAQQMSATSGRTVSVSEVRANLRLSEGYDAVNQSLFGRPLTSLDSLDMDEMKALRTAWTGKPALSELDASAGLGARDITTRIHAGRVLGIAGLALEVYDGAQTAREVGRLRGEGNDTAAESELIHFGSRSVGGLGGAAIGAGAGGVFTSWSGPGMLVGGGVGGIAGVFGGEKVADWIDNRRIYNQDDRAGNTWTFDPGHRDRGWERRAAIDASLDGVDNARRGTLRAPPSLANELDYKATTVSVELILGSPPAQRNPFSQAANEHDAHSSRTSNWEHDPDHGQWTRKVYGGFVERGMTPYHTETASPERAAQLDRAAAQVVLENAQHSPASIAARYEDGYIRNGWAAHGPMPDAVRSARTGIDTLVASDENRYQRQADGRWVSDGMLYDSTARGVLHAELEATRAVLEARLPPPREIPPPVPMTAEDRVRDTVAGAYANAGVDASPERIAAAATAVQATWATRGLDPGTTALDIRPDATGRQSLDSAIGHLQWDAQARRYELVTVTGIEEVRTAETAQRAAPADATPQRHATDDAIPTLAPVSAVVPNQAPGGDADVAAPGRAAALLADHPAHADHDTFTRIHDWVRGTGQWDDAASRNVACALYREQACDPLIRRVDMVAGGLGPNGEQNVFAFHAPYGDRGPVFHARVDGREAALQPAQPNLEQAEHARQQAAQQQRSEAQQRQEPQAQRPPELAM